MDFLKKYEAIVLLNHEFNDSELKTWVFSFARCLKKLNFYEISVISRGKHKLSYPIREKTKGNFIQINFVSAPKSIDSGLEKLKNNSSILRFLIFKK